MTKLRSLARWLWQHKLFTVAALVAFGLVSTVAGTAVGLTLEEYNDLCMQCHTQPEYDFWLRTQVALKPPHETNDLATFHVVPTQDSKKPNREPLKCISCHGGPTLPDRVSTALELGALDTIKFVAFDIQQPAKMSHPLPNRFCEQCHREDIERKGFDNHFHNKLDEPKAPPLMCVDCHASHADADVLNKFVLRERAYPQCNACHKELGGPINLR
ncbi:MAG: hypothetical protein LC737_01525 [Chloroflexi bacterium]|nr:hypothetical protein [Chloroflexota bacterium]